MGNKAYNNYINSKRWYNKREMRLKRDGYQCQFCKAHGVQLNVHHLNYHNFRKEKMADLVTCCIPCHNHLDDIRILIKDIKNQSSKKCKQVDKILEDYGYPHNMKKDREYLKGLKRTLKTFKRMKV